MSDKRMGMQQFYREHISGKGFVPREIVRKTWLHQQDDIKRLQAQLDAARELVKLQLDNAHDRRTRSYLKVIKEALKEAGDAPDPWEGVDDHLKRQKEEYWENVQEDPRDW